MTEVAKGLYLGDYVTACNEEWLRQHNITLVVNCTKDLSMPSNPILGLRLPVDDIYTANETVRNGEITAMDTYLDDVVNIIEYVVRQGHGVLVHCLHGIQRSATVIVAYLLKYGGESWKRQPITVAYTGQDYLDRVIGYLLTLRPHVFCQGTHINFIQSLRTYDKKAYFKQLKYLLL